LAADATNRYKHIPGIDDVTRYVVFVRPGYFLMLDNLAAGEQHAYQWVSHFGGPPSVEGNWIKAEAGEGQVLGVEVISPEKFETVIGDDGLPYVHIQPASPVAATQFINLLFPLDIDTWESRPGAVLLDKNESAAAVRITTTGDKPHTDDILLSFAQSTSLVNISSYQFDGRIAALTYKTGGALQKIFMYGGTILVDQEEHRDLVKNLDGLGSIEVVYEGNLVSVFGSSFTDVVLYAPNADSLSVNGELRAFTRSNEYIVFSSSRTQTGCKYVYD
jgi:hypothetical protein